MCSSYYTAPVVSNANPSLRVSLDPFITGVVETSIKKKKEITEKDTQDIMNKKTAITITIEEINTLHSYAIVCKEKALEKKKNI